MAGETTVDLVTTTSLPTSRTAGEMIAHKNTVALRTTDLALNDVTGVCKVPKNATVFGFFLFTDDLDSNGAEALVWSVLVGSTVVQAGVTNATAKAGTFFACTGGPLTVTDDTIVYLKATTAAATAAAGNATVTPVYTTSN